MNNLIQTFAVYALPILFAITLHEAAHAYAARYFGDNTAFMQGRMSLNPTKHIDPVGTLLIPILLFFVGSPFLFGYAKPVPVNFGRLRHPKRDMIWVALAGPASNFVQAIFWALLLVVMLAAGVDETFFIKMAQGGVLVNLVMWAFNLFPLPPLDGGRVLAGLLPNGPAQNFLARIEPFGFFIVMGLVLAGVVSTFWLLPLMDAGYAVLNLLISPLTALLR
jgi:Zn-dependent protease